MRLRILGERNGHVASRTDGCNSNTILHRAISVEDAPGAFDNRDRLHAEEKCPGMGYLLVALPHSGLGRISWH